MNFNWQAILPAVVSVGSYISLMSGNPVLAAVISNPHTAETATAVVGGIGALVSAFMPAVHKPAS